MDDRAEKRSDVELLVAARSNPQAFAEFYRRHAIAVERWLQTQLPDPATAADLTAETFAQALVGLKRFHDARDEQAVAWLFAIARNLVRRFHRRGKAELRMCRRLGIQLDHGAEELAPAGSPNRCPRRGLWAVRCPRRPARRPTPSAATAGD